MYGEEDSGPVKADGPGERKPPLPAQGPPGNLNKEVTMVRKFIWDHAWKFPLMRPLTFKRGVKGGPENPPEHFPEVSGGTQVHQHNPSD